MTEASRHPDVFSSASGATSIQDLPAEFNEYFGSMINMDDPRHARLRRIVSRAFTPRMIKKFEHDVQLTAAEIVDDLLAIGRCTRRGRSVHFAQAQACGAVSGKVVATGQVAVSIAGERPGAPWQTP